MFARSFLSTGKPKRGGSKVSHYEKKLGKPVSDEMRGQAATEAQSFNEAKLAETCTKSFMEALPPPFCWKKGADVGVIPTGCPAGYFRHLALCFENCRPGFEFDGGALCIEGCPKHYSVYPLTCTLWKPLLWECKTVGRDVYAPKSITNFDAPCEQDYYKGGALCYRDCAKIGMVNCGIGMCAADDATCASDLTEMVVDVVSGIGKAVGFALSFGASGAINTALSAAKTAAKGASKIVQKAVKAATKVIQRVMKSNGLKQQLKSKVKKLVKKALKQFVMGKDQEDKSADVCDGVSDGLMEKMDNEPKPGFDIQNLDVIGIGDIVNSCSNVKDANGGVGCAKSILSTLENFDPTGLAGVAAAFMQPTCDV